MKQIIIIQHCQSQHHVNGMMGGWNDWELTDLGREQARRIGERLGAELQGQSVKIYSSDLKRAAQTAAPFAGKLGIEVEYRQELREHNDGPEAIGKSAQWYRENCGPHLTVDDRPLPGSETQREMYQRLAPLVDEILERPEDIIVLVSHGGALMVFNTLWLGLPVETLNSCSIRGIPGGVGVFGVHDGRIRNILRIADPSYMRE